MFKEGSREFKRVCVLFVRIDGVRVGGSSTALLLQLHISLVPLANLTVLLSWVVVMFLEWDTAQALLERDSYFRRFWNLGSTRMNTVPIFANNTRHVVL